MGILVGRQPQLATIADALSEASRGGGSLLLLGGDPGIGKSRLTEAAAGMAAERGMTVAGGYAVDDPGAPPLWPWRRAASGIPELLAALDTASADTADSNASARFRLFVDVASRLRAIAQPQGLLLVLEDLHWADRTSVLLLRHLAAELAGARVLVIVTYRHTAASVFSASLGDLLRGSGNRLVAVEGLSAGAVDDWFRADPALVRCAAIADQLLERTSGNPLLLRLLAEALAASENPSGKELDTLLVMRPDLRGLVKARLAPLSEGARRVLEAASVIAERIVPDLVSAVAQLPEPDVSPLLAEAVAAGVLRSGASGMGFVHALVRDAVYADLSPRTRIDLHRRTAASLQRADQPDLAGLIASHWRRAGELERCVEWATVAARHAQGSLAFDESVDFAQMAVDCAVEAGIGVGRRAELTLELATARFSANQIRPSVQACVEAADLAEAAGRIDLLAAAGLVLHGVGAVDIYRIMRGLCERALAVLGPGELAQRARLLAQVAVASAEDESGARSRELSAQALAAAESSGDTEAIIEAIAARHLSIAIPETVQERMQLASRAIELGARAKAPIAELWGHLWRLEASLQLGDLADFDRELAVIDQIATTRRSQIARWHHHRLSATRSLLIGDFAAALDSTEAARALASRMDDSSMSGMYFAFMRDVAVLRGDPATLPAGMQDALAFAPPIPLVRIAVPINLALQGDRAAAVAAFEEFRDIPATFPVGVRWAATLSQIGVAATLLQDAQVAEAVYEVLLPTAGYCTGDGSGAVVCFGSNARALADLAFVAGRYDEAIGLYRQAHTVNARLGARPFLALGRFGLARAIVAMYGAGDARRPANLPEARKLLEDAIAEFRRLDMPGPLAESLSFARTLAAERERVGGLTAREAQIAGLVADSRSNRDIAQQLFLSERTVESHVRNILAKLNFSNRTEVVSWVLGQAARPESRGASASR